MNPRSRFVRARVGIAATALAAGLAGCSSMKAEDVVVYSDAQLKQGQYETVARLWVENWRARFWTPTYSADEDPIESLRIKAARLGANGLTNIACYGDKGFMSLWPVSFNCYAKAIKVSEPDGVIRP